MSVFTFFAISSGSGSCLFLCHGINLYFRRHIQKFLYGTGLRGMDYGGFVFCRESMREVDVQDDFFHKVCCQVTIDGLGDGYFVSGDGTGLAKG